MSTNNQNQNGRNAQNLNDQRPVLQTSGYNGSEPTAAKSSLLAILDFV